MASEYLQKTLHLVNNLIVEDIHIAVELGHVSGCSLLKLSFDLLLNFFASPVLLFTIFAQDSIDGFLNRLLVTLLANLDDLTHNNVFQLVLEQVNLISVLVDLKVGYELPLELSAQNFLLLV